MKKLYILLSCLFVSFVVQAQEPAMPEFDEKKQQNIEALKVAFITRELELTAEEAQKFWPVYNQYSNEIKTVAKETKDPLDRDEKTLNIKKKYKEQFTKIVGPDRVNKLFNLEHKFRQLLIKAMNKRQQMREGRGFRGRRLGDREQKIPQ